VSRVAVVTLAHGRHDHLEAQHDSLARGTRLPDLYVVAAMDDPRLRPTSQWGLRRHVVRVPRHPLGLHLSVARNRGVAHTLSRGADVVVILDVDCLAGRELVAAYAEACLEQPSTVWSGPVSYLAQPLSSSYPLDRLDLLEDPHPARPDPGPGRRVRNPDPDLFWSLSFAVSRQAWQHVGGFCEDYVGYGSEDTDFALRVVDAGLEHGWLGDARAYHQWHPVSSPPVEHLDDILRNASIFHDHWGRWPMKGWLAAFEERGLAVHRQGRWERGPGAA
jgi:N-acetylglucosaminyl-diphospho-decaprenol L-rhamnosyltransferase